MLLQWAMKNVRPAFVVYAPPVVGLPFLAVVIAVNGSVTSVAFDTSEEAAAYNRLIARAAGLGEGRRH